MSNKSIQIWHSKVTDALSSKTHPQQAMLDASWLIIFAEKRGLRISERDLKVWSKMDLFHSHSSNAVLYHPYQIFRLRSLTQGVLQSCYFPSFHVPDGLESMFKENLKQHKDALQGNEEFDLKCLYLLTTIEDRYLPELRGERHMIKTTSFGFQDEPKSWFDLQKTFDAILILKGLSLSIEEIVTIRQELAFRGWAIDPNRLWIDLIHQIPFDRRQQLRGDALLAWDYYEAAELISNFLYDSTGENHSGDFILGDWKNLLYNPTLKKDHGKNKQALKQTLARFTIDSRLKALLIVEGKSEQIYIDYWCELQGIDLGSYDIQICYLDGINGLKQEAIKQRAKSARSPDIDAAVIVIADREGDAPDQIQKWFDEGIIRKIFTPAELQGLNHPIGGMLWDKCFEDDNFTQDELLDTWIELIQNDSRKYVVDRNVMELAIQHALDNTEPEKGYEKPIAYIRAMGVANRKLHFPFVKPEMARQLCKRYLNTDRPIHRLIEHVRIGAIFSATYGPAQPDGGYGKIDEDD